MQPKRNNMKVRDFIKFAQQTAAKENEEERDKTIMDAEIMVDCLEGDRFGASIGYNQKNNVVAFILHRGSRKWIEMGIEHPVKLTTEK